jgi:hypothetical protein
LQQSTAINYNFATPLTNVGNVQACDAVAEFISYQIDSDPTVYLLDNVNAGTSQQGGPNTELYINGNGSATGGSGLYIWGNTNTVGIYTTAQFSIEGSGVGYIGSTTTNTVQFNLTQVGAVGGYIEMTFSGTYMDSNNLSHTLTGAAHVIRDN